MFISALNRKLFRDLASLRSQTLTTAILIISGVSLLVSAWSAYHSLQTSRDDYYARYRFANIFVELKNAPSAVVEQIRQVSGIEVANERIIYDGIVDVPTQNEPAVGRFISLPDDNPASLNRIYLRKGRMPQKADLPEVVVHEGFATVHGLQPGDHLSFVIRGRKEVAVIVGVGISPEYVYALSPAAALPDDRHFGIFWMEKNALERMARMVDAFNSVIIRLTDDASESAVIADVDRILSIYGSGGAYGRNKQISSMFVNDEIAQQRTTAIFSPTVFLSIAAFLINIIFSRLIALQRSQIAILKAIGYSSRTVSLHYLSLIFIMLSVGILPAIAMGSWLGTFYASSYANFFRFPQIDFSLSVESIVIGVIAGIVPGLLGAYRSILTAFRLPPAEAMRPLAPPAFHATLFDRIGINNHVGMRGRMVLRNLLFRPLRLFMSIAGIAAAVSIVITAGFWTDTINYLLDTQFQRLQREDLSVGFLKPVTLAGLHELRSIPGVIEVEGYRAVPVRLRKENLNKETVVMGWPQESNMRKRLNTQLQEIPLAEDGILLSRFFERKWGIQRGQLIDIEVLEAKREKLQFRVAGFTDDLIGSSVTIEIGELWKTLGELPGYNLATVRIDPRRAEEIYIRLKEYPSIGSVTMKTSIYRGFQDTMGGMIEKSTFVLIAFSLLITFGIIYNSIRVSFSERSWELASLRVLGFTKIEVFFALLTEISVQVLFAIVPGLILGTLLANLSIELVNTEVFGFPAIVRPSTYAIAILVTLSGLAIGVALVYRMIGKFSLAETLKERE